MKPETRDQEPRRLRGGIWGPLLALAFVLTGLAFLVLTYVSPHLSRGYGKEIAFHRAMFGAALVQPIAFSHRLHVTDKQIDCYYCHAFPERSMHSGLPSADKCLACHQYIIPEHQEIRVLKGFKARGETIPWVRVYYNPDHVYFPHFRHINKGVECQECHGQVEKVDRLHQVTFYMGFCLECHDRKQASRDCAACHQ